MRWIARRYKYSPPLLGSLLLGWVCGALFFSFTPSPEAEPAQTSTPGKYFIELGWDIPNTEFMRQNAKEMEAKGPFDGLMFKLEARDPKGNNCTSEWCWDETPWEREWFLGAIEDLKQCHFTRFKHNFIRFNSSPGTLSWEDDSGWAALTNKVAIAAWVARQGGARGLAPDFESYQKRQFEFDPTLGKSFSETAQQARKRGAQFIKAIAAEYPDAVLMPLWLNSINLSSAQSSSPDELLSGAPYGLLPAFINGMLDGLPPEMILVDGCENGYYMDSLSEYLTAAHELRSWGGAALKLVAPENRPKYRQQVQVGFGFYLDMYLNEGGTFYYPPLDGSRLKRLYRNLSAAREAADQYVWIYGEQARWWPAPPIGEWMAERMAQTVGKGRPWEEALPGITRAIQWSQDPLLAARAQVEQARQDHSLTNLVPNPHFAQKPESPDLLPPSYLPWQEKGSQGVFSWDSSVGEGSGRAQKVLRGTLMARYPVHAGELFLVEADCLKQGGGHTDLMIRWQKSDESWTRWHDDKTFTFQPTGKRKRNLNGAVLKESSRFQKMWASSSFCSMSRASFKRKTGAGLTMSGSIA